MSQTGIEITAICPLAAPQFRLNHVWIAIDNAEIKSEWTVPHFYPIGPGKHSIHVCLKSYLNFKTMHATATIQLAEGQVHRLRYSVPATVFGMIANGFDMGKMQDLGAISGARYASQVTATLPSVTSPPVIAAARSTVSKKTKSSTERTAPTAFCGECGQPLVGRAKFCTSCGTAVPV